MVTSLKKDQREEKLDLVTDIDMLLIVEKGIRGGICNAIHRYVKDHNKNKEFFYLNYRGLNNLYG